MTTGNRIERVEIMGLLRSSREPRQIHGHLKVDARIVKLCEENNIKLLIPEQVPVALAVTEDVYYEQLKKMNPTDSIEYFDRDAVQLDIEGFEMIPGYVFALDPVFRGVITKIHRLKSGTAV